MEETEGRLGTVGKAPVAGVIDRPTNQVTTKVVVSTNRATLQGFVEGNTKEGAEVDPENWTAG